MAADEKREAEKTLVLASASPRRKELLAQLGLTFTQRVVAIDEIPHPGEAAQDFVCRMARDKATAVHQALSQSGVSLLTNTVILAADTIVVVDGEIIGKPIDEAHGLAILASLAGRSHQVMTAIAVQYADQLSEALSISEVQFAPLNESELVAYWQTGEGQDKAGAYAIQGRAAQFITHISGSYSGVMGLPLYDTARLLKRAGITVLSTNYE